MIDYIWHLRGSVALVDSANLAFDRIENLLTAQHKGVRERGDNYLTFNDPLWQNMSPNWLAMVIYDRGRFWIENSLNGPTLRYELRSLHGLIFCIIVAVVGFTFGLVGGGLSHGLQFAAFAFGWLYGMNLVLAFWRVPRAIRKAVKLGYS